MEFKIAKYFLLILFVLLFSACGDSLPLAGELDPVDGYSDNESASDSTTEEDEEGDEETMDEETIDEETMDEGGEGDPSTGSGQGGEGEGEGEDEGEGEISCEFDYDAVVSTGIEVGTGLLSGYEPSGAVWHEGLEMFFIVSDGGYVSMMDSDGSSVVDWNIGGDFEAITVVDTDSDFVYIGIENPDGVKEFDIDLGVVTRTFDLTPWMTGASNQGLEALTFVPNDISSEGGYFYAGLQATGRVYVFELPIVTSSILETVTLIDSFIPVSGRTDISGLDYDEVSGTIYSLYDGYDKITEFDILGNMLNDWTLHGDNQEGLAIGPGCEMLISEDDGNVLRYDL